MAKTLEPPRRSGAAILGRDEYRVEGRAKVSGEAKYSADFELPGMLWAAFTRSTTPHARIASIDTSAARAMAGVATVLTGEEIGEHYQGRTLFDMPVIARDRVRFIGEVVAAVAAETREIAEAAAASIEIEYEELPGIFEPEEALAPGAPVLHEHPERYPYTGKQRPAVPHPNVQGHHVAQKGDVEAALRGAARTFEHTFSTPRYHGGFIEPRATLVWIDGAGVLHVISTNKTPYALRDQLAVATGLPKSKIIVEPAFVGGDFGAKGFSPDEFPCYFLARATSKPVKYVRSYLDDLQATNVRHPSRITVRSGVDAEGRFVAVDIKVLYNGGAYGAAKPSPQVLPGGVAKTPYRIPNGRLTRTAVYTNTIPAGHVRAPGDIQIHFALESHVDMVARELGIDPLEFRLRNAVGKDDADIDGDLYLEPRAVEILETLRKVTDWSTPRPAGRGRGVALAVRHIGDGKSFVNLVLADGKLVVRTGVADQGGGALSVAQRCVAATLNLDPGRIGVERANTASVEYDAGTGGSRETNAIGWASVDAATKLRARLEAHGWDGSGATFDAAAAKLLAKEGPVEVVGSHEGGHDHEGPVANNFSGYVAEVSVDDETGAVTIHDLTIVADVGAIINPVAHQGQVNGGVVFGIGSGFTEEMRLEGGKIVNLSLGEYKLPTQADIPPLRTVLLETPGGPGPFGAKMAGELSTSGVAPAIANAVADACRARVTELPVTAERVYKALHP